METIADFPQKRRTLVSPWKDVHEFQQVYEAIYSVSSNIKRKEYALSQIRVWNLRRGVLCPAAVLATSILFEVQLQDQQKQHKPRDMQTLYASAFLRFFNFMSSIMQTYNMRTMYETARHLGLESYVVDLRHICAHGQDLPPLELLRSTTIYCMGWLHDYYWSEQLVGMVAVDASKIRRKDKTEFDGKVTDFFILYDAALECKLKGANNMQTAKRFVHGKRYSALKAYCERKKLEDITGVCALVLKESAVLVKRANNIKDLNEIYIEALQNMVYFFAVAEAIKTDQFLQELLDATQNLFRMLSSNGFIEDFFFALLHMAENTTDMTRRATARFWAQQILQGFLAFRKCKQIQKAQLEANCKRKKYDLYSINVVGVSEQLRKLLVEAGVDSKRTLIFADSLSRPWASVFEKGFIEKHLASLSDHTSFIKHFIALVNPEITARQMKSLNALVDAYISTEELSAMDVKIPPAERLLVRLDAQKNKVSSALAKANSQNEATEEQQFGIWSLVPDEYNWSICAVGGLPWD